MTRLHISRPAGLARLVTVGALLGALSAAGALVIEAEKAATKTTGAANHGGGWNLYSNGEVGQMVRIAAAGNYQVVVRAWGSVAGGVWPEMALRVDGHPVKTVAVNSTNQADYHFTVDLPAGTREIAAAFLNDAMIGKEDRNLYLERFTIIPPADIPGPALSDGRELAEQAERREGEIIVATAAAIEKNRKSDAVVRVVDAAGKPVAGAQIAVIQTAHEFLFGCNIYEFKSGDPYRQRFAELFNYATVGFYWRWYEREHGQPKYADTDPVVAWCLAHDIRMKGHPLLWGHEAGIPPWSKGQPTPEIQRQRVADIMTRYRDKIFAWEVVNEPAHQPIPKIDAPYRWARAIHSNAYLIVNDYNILADGCPPFFQLLTTAKQSGVPFDGIGIQAHEPRAQRFPLDRVQRILDRYATLGKELHITEFTPASSGEKITGAHGCGVWNEAAQADYAVKFYRVCFAHPAVRAITWWDLSDKGAWRKGGGLLRADMSPKPVYDALKRLIHTEWKTNSAGRTDAEGRFTFRGFRGRYRLVVNGVEQPFQLGPGATDVTITVP
ncbi:MAG: endo-1,4-beta-xylanase [Kiritimatiellaeota bacterium]|nr:endo-1,4-beta-xylanase [Kiritimatiellota bacterium]